ncbi:MAG: hypothetical protein FWG40_10955, partial [Peptococcaceae bacterium]|nr:hypothetical protein [Peptococcaceae bacterium]
GDFRDVSQDIEGVAVGSESDEFGADQGGAVLGLVGGVPVGEFVFVMGVDRGVSGDIARFAVASSILCISRFRKIFQHNNLIAPLAVGGILSKSSKV